MKVEYDMEKEMGNLRKKSDKILKKYPNINGLENILNENLAQFNSKPFKTLTKNLVDYINVFEKNHDLWDEIGIKSVNDIDTIEEEFKMLKFSLILNKSPKILIPFINRSDTIVFEHFVDIIYFNIGLLSLKGDKNDITNFKVFKLTNKLLISLDDFDQDIADNIIDEDFFKSLKGIKWDKNAVKLFEKILSILLDIVDLVIRTLFSDILRNIFIIYRATLTILIACSAVNDGRDIMEYGDVIRAFRTFYKLIDADIDDLV